MSNVTAHQDFIPCSAKHKGCTKAHAELVWGFRVERRRQELQLEAITGGYAADKADYFARGGAPLITFKAWLQAHKGSGKPAVEVAKVATVVVEVVADDDAPVWAIVPAGPNPFDKQVA